MSLQKAEAYLESKGFSDHVITLGESTATVALAAQVLGVQPGMIAKTMSFLQGDQVVLILTEGTAKVDNRKYKDTFHVKAKMIPFEEVEEKVVTPNMGRKRSAEIRPSWTRKLEGKKPDCSTRKRMRSFM